MLTRKPGSDPKTVLAQVPGYVVAVLAVGLALLVKLLLDPLIDEESPFLLFFGAVIIGTWFGGLGPGLLATALATLTAGYFFLSPTYPLLVDDFGQVLRLALFVLEGAFISVLVAIMRSARRQSEARTLQSRRDQEDLRRSEERFRATFEQAAVGIAHVGFGGEWLRVNQKLCDIVGYTREELLERTFQDITHPDRIQDNLDLFVPLMTGEISTFSIEKRYFRKDGSIVWIDLTVSAACDGGGKPSYTIAVIEDITERKRVEEAQRFLVEAGMALSSSLDHRATLVPISRCLISPTGASSTSSRRMALWIGWRWLTRIRRRSRGHTSCRSGTRQTWIVRTGWDGRCVPDVPSWSPRFPNRSWRRLPAMPSIARSCKTWASSRT